MKIYDEKKMQNIHSTVLGIFQKNIRLDYIIIFNNQQNEDGTNISYTYSNILLKNDMCNEGAHF